MSEIYSNSFTSKISRPTTSTAIYSNTFITTVNKVVVEETGNSTKINIYNGTTPLVAVNTTPTKGQYKVTITDTTNCTANLENDHKTITLLTVTGNAGEIHATINIEGKTTVNKTIPVAAITKSSVIKATETQYQQLSDRFSWWVRGNSTSSMQLTQDALNIITKQVKIDGDMIVDGAIDGKTITGATIIGSTFRNQNDTFSVDSEGNIVGAQIKGSEVVGDSFSVEGELTADTITANKINNAQYPSTLDDDIQIEIDPSTGSDDIELADGAVYQTIAGVLDALPKFLNGKRVNIWMRDDISENADFQNYTSGQIRFYLDGHTLYGYIRNYMSSAKLWVYGGWPGTEEGQIGVVHPDTGCAVAGRTGSIISQESSSLNTYSVKVYGSDNKHSDGQSNIVGYIGDAFASMYIKNTTLVNCEIGYRGSGCARIHDASSDGVCSQYGFQTTSGAFITIANAAHCGGLTANTAQTLPGQIIQHGKATFAGGSQTTDPGKAPTTSTKKTVTIQSNSGDTYRSSVYNNWKRIIPSDKGIMVMVTVMDVGSSVLNLINSKVKILVKLNLLLKEYQVVLMQESQL